MLVPIPRGNKVRDTNGYRRTCPSVLKAIKIAVTTGTRGKIYMNIVTANTVLTQQGILNPRNYIQEYTNSKHSPNTTRYPEPKELYTRTS